MTFLVLVVVSVILAKQKEHYMKGQLNMLGLTITAVYKHLNDCTGVQNLFDIASLHSLLFTSSVPFQNSDKFDLKTAHINLLQDNTEITDRHRDWNIVFKEVLKIKG